ncbi:MAG: ABC transporter ATP-binding protein [Phototrophicales bacterium]|nr:ABC transporter ATP-binding protein [Phototrophicales bacterium]
MSGFVIWKRMMAYLKPYGKWAFLAFMALVFSNMLVIIIPTILRDVIDIGIIGEMPLAVASPQAFVAPLNDLAMTYGKPDYMLIAGFLIVGLGVLRGITGFAFRYFGEKLSHFIAYDIRNEVYNKVQNQSFTYHDESQTGTIITRAISDVDEIQRYFAFGLMDGLNTAMLVIGVAMIMFVTSPVLAVLGLLPLIPLVFFSRGFALFVDPAWRSVMERLQKLGNYLQENSTGAEVVRAFTREEFEINKFGKENETLYHDHMRLINRWATYLPTSAFIIAFSTGLVLFFGALMERSGFGGVTVGVVVAFNAYVFLIAQPIRFLGFVILLITQAISSGRRVFEILDAPELIADKPNAVVLEDIQGIVQFKDVNLTYANTTQPVLKNINFTAHPGEVVAIVGATGSGKSSLVNLIPRFYDVTEGGVTIDGYDVRDVKLTSIRDRIGVVLQSSLLFSATIRENIAYGKPNASEEEIIAAAKAANAHGFISEFPDGYNTRVGERGVTLSGGQKQRVAIARSLLINPRILILDDSTSSVDTKTEYSIQQALSIIMRGRTTFIIAQRLNSVKDADQILVLKDGEIIEQGRHEQLLALNGYYAETYRLQLADQEKVRNELLALGEIIDEPTPQTADMRLATDEFRAILDEVGGD